MSESQAFNIVLGAQLLYVALGAGYNLVSLARLARGEPALAPTNPRTGLYFMTALIVPVVLGWAGHPLAFALLWLPLGFMILRGGVLPHAIALVAGGAALERYASRGCCQLALAINCFGIATIASGVVFVLL